MGRLVCMVVLLATMALGQESYLPGDAEGLGGLETQMVLDYFKSIDHPKLMFNWHDAAAKAALLAKKDAGIPYLSTNWTGNIARALTPLYGHAIHSAIYFNLMGFSAGDVTTFSDYVNSFSPVSTIDGSYGSGSSQIGGFVAALFSYDALVGAGHLTQTERDAFKAKVIQQLGYIRANIPRPATVGNSSSLVVAVVGMAAIVFPDETDSYYWLDWALKWHYMAYKELSNEAAVMEGASYQLGYAISGYCADFMITLEEHGFPVVDRADNFLEEIYTWMVKVHRPDMCAVEAEDCYADTKPSSIWPAKYIKASTEERRALQWYAQQINNTNETNNYITWDTSLDHTAPPQWNPTQFFPTSSCAVFRNGFGGDESWLYFLGDRMPMYFSYGGVGGWIYNKNHGHNDATSITLYAHGQYLLTETARFRGITTQWHNLIMVDDNDAEPSFAIASENKYTTLSNTFATPKLDGADMSITYVSTDFVRTVLYAKEFGSSPENEYYVVIDDVEANDDADHIYKLLFHNKRGDITGSGNKMWTTQTDSSLAEIHFLEPDLVSVVRTEAEQGSGAYPSMDYMDHRITARYDGQSFQYVTVLYPRTVSMSAPAVAELNGTYYKGGTVTSGTMQDIVLSQKPGTEETLGGITSNGTQVMVRTVSGTPIMYMLKGGTSLAYNGTTLLSSDAPISVAALTYASSSRITGTVIVEQPANITFTSSDGSVSSWKYFAAGEYTDFSFSLATGGKATGTVTDEDLGTGIPNVKVEAIQGTDSSYCLTGADGTYRFEWVRPGTNTFRFSRAGYTTASVAGQTITSGNTLTLDRVLSITTAAPGIVSVQPLKTTNSSVQVLVQTDKPCKNMIEYGTSTSYGSQTTQTTGLTETDTVLLSGLTGGQLYHYRVTVTDFDGRTAQSADVEVMPIGEFSDDFEDASYADKWTTSSTLWSEASGVLKKTSGGNFAYSPKRLNDLIFPADGMYSSFTLTIKGRSLRSSDLRDLCVVFNYEDDTHYYYAQFSMTASTDYNGIFKVNGTDKEKIGSAGDATLVGDAWADIKIVRDLSDGSILAYCDDMSTPCFSASDNAMGLGKIALGSERSVVEFDDILVKPGAETGIWDPRVVETRHVASLQIVGPNPRHIGETITFTNLTGPVMVYDRTGGMITTVRANGGSPGCWHTANITPGIYYIRSGNAVQKIMVVR